MSIEATIAERGASYGEYGNFNDKAMFAQDVKEMFRATPGWDACEADQREALDMIAHKIARLLCGNPDHEDSWRDVAGYAMLVSKRLQP